MLKIIEILRREIITAMRLVGAAGVSDLKPEMVCFNTMSIMSIDRLY